MLPEKNEELAIYAYRSSILPTEEKLTDEL